MPPKSETTTPKRVCRERCFLHSRQHVCIMNHVLKKRLLNSHDVFVKTCEVPLYALHTLLCLLCFDCFALSYFAFRLRFALLGLRCFACFVLRRLPCWSVLALCCVNRCVYFVLLCLLDVTLRRVAYVALLASLCLVSLRFGCFPLLRSAWFGLLCFVSLRLIYMQHFFSLPSLPSFSQILWRNEWVESTELFARASEIKSIWPNADPWNSFWPALVTSEKWEKKHTTRHTCSNQSDHQIQTKSRFTNRCMAT